MAEGSSTNADTAVLTIWLVRSGQYDYYATVSGWDTRNGRSYYTTIVSDGYNDTYRLELRSDLISTTASVGKAIGKGVRSVNSFPHLLSGSYGLAEGSGLTNGDTAALALEFYRSGAIFFYNGNTSTSRGYLKTSTITAGVSASIFLLYETTNNPIATAERGYGYSVR